MEAPHSSPAAPDLPDIKSVLFCSRITRARESRVSPHGPGEGSLRGEVAAASIVSSLVLSVLFVIVIAGPAHVSGEREPMVKPGLTEPFGELGGW